MNILQRYKIFLLLCLAFALHSCKKLIDIKPPVSIIGTDQLFKTNAQANSAMAGVYSQMMTNSGGMLFCNGGLTIYAGMSADEVVNLTGQDNLNDYQFRINQLDFTNSVPGGIVWRPAYKIIYSANAVIEGIAASTSSLLDDSTRRVLTGEALFVRAFCYFYLTNLFGDVPLVLTTDFRQTSSMQRTPQTTIFSQIVQDLQDAQAILPGDYSTAGGERIRPNKWAATALLARTQLYLQNWEDAETQASAVIDNNSQFALLTNLKSVFLKNSREAIWQLQQNTARNPYNATWESVNFLPLVKWSDFSPAEQAILAFPQYFQIYAPYMIPAYYLTPQVVQTFETGDNRKRMWTDSTPTPIGAPYNGVAYYYPVKYVTPAGILANPVPTEYYMVLRFAEQYLIRAEARAQRNDLSGAAADINILRKRAGLPNTTADTKEALLAAVAHERQTELFAEWGHRWLDLKRTNQANTVLGTIASKQPWKSSQLLYPIPPDEISANPNIIQNPDY
jgi:hypothetical protein